MQYFKQNITNKLYYNKDCPNSYSKCFTNWFEMVPFHTQFKLPFFIENRTQFCHEYLIQMDTILCDAENYIYNDKKRTKVCYDLQILIKCTHWHSRYLWTTFCTSDLQKLVEKISETIKTNLKIIVHMNK